MSRFTSCNIVSMKSYSKFKPYGQSWKLVFKEHCSSLNKSSQP